MKNFTASEHSYSFVNNFVDLGNKKLEEYFLVKIFKNKFSKDTLKTKNPQHNTSCRRRK